jgi:hypothetical protein
MYTVHWLMFLLAFGNMYTVHWLRFLLTWLRFFLPLTEVFPCVFFICKANAKVKLKKTGHGSHSFTFVICVVRLLFVLFCVFVCKCVLPPGDNSIAVNKYINISILINFWSCLVDLSPYRGMNVSSRYVWRTYIILYSIALACWNICTQHVLEKIKYEQYWPCNDWIYTVCLKSKCTDFPMDELEM